jgi:apoptosis-inducing factor 2
VTTNKGKMIKADLVVFLRIFPHMCYSPNCELQLQACGPKPATRLLSSLPSSLTPTGHVRVKPTLQLVDYPCIFAAGDIIDWDEQKQAGKVGAHADVITANVLSILNGKHAKKAYKTGAEMILVSNGKVGTFILVILVAISIFLSRQDRGVSYFGILWGLVCGDWVTKLIKSKDLHIAEGRGYMNLSN